ncbi:hypothetical protein MPNT_120003 [Candidatus Methylacidithermus pantelleriae]|uniref:Uncharacterized protein n=1 Tax=Candidatus Methylacidithermus pantelleriae TaxID=2744239 RepID=A0A8J2BR25_9BACT|nr:hypothetical protein MPNT_120003 [Candidatus Methylacidithermus pantelleriae]
MDGQKRNWTRFGRRSKAKTRSVFPRTPNPLGKYHPKRQMVAPELSRRPWANDGKLQGLTNVKPVVVSYLFFSH